MQFRARLATVRGTPSRADDVRTVVRLNLEAHDISTDWLFEQLGEDLVVDLNLGPLVKLPLDEALEQSSPNGTVDHSTEQEQVVVPSNGRRRHGTRSSEQV